MILQALVEYYEALAAKGEIAKQGWGRAKVSYALDISAEGNLLRVIPLTTEETRGKKIVIVPQQIMLPEGTKRSSGVAAQFLWDNASYILGLDKGGKPERSKKCFEATKIKLMEILDKVDNEAAQALKAFFNNWNVDRAAENEVLKPWIEELLGGANITFYFNGKYIAEDREIAEAWNVYNAVDDGEPKARCLVTGKVDTIARLHPNIKGVRNAQSSGAALVSFNADAYESYGHEQGYNAPVSKYAAFAYTTALNTLLASSKNTKVIGDTTIVYWAQSAEEAYTDCFGMSIADDNDSDEILDGFFEKLSKGLPLEFNNCTIDPATRFYVLGISPNAARLSIRFFLVNIFGSIMENVKKHYDNLEIAAYDKKRLPLWRILQETANKNAKEKAATPLLTGAVLRSVLTGQRYPQSLYQNIILRAKADQDNPEKKIAKIGKVKAAVIKACLIKNYGYKEVATVGLNEDSKDTAYVLGCLFAVLENLQESANPGIVGTIKDRYFNSACSTPRMVFPILMKLANYHLRKLRSNKGWAIAFEKQIGKLQNKIEMREHPLPARFNLEEQGKFILGYYHQTQKRYEKKEEK